MHSAAVERRPEIMKILLEKEGDPRILTSHKYTPLHFAAQYGSEECVKLLLAACKENGQEGAEKRTNKRPGRPRRERKVQTNAQEKTNAQEGAEKYVNMRTKQGLTALMFAAKDGFLEICKLLKSTEVNLQCVKGKTALHYALTKGLERVVSYVVDGLQADCLIKGKDGDLPLHLSLCGRKECFSYMLKKTDSNALNDDVVADLVKLAATKSLKNIKIMADDVKFQESLTTYYDSRNNNLLHLTVVRESYSSALALIRKTKISKTSKNSDDNTPLHLLIMHSGRALPDQDAERRQVQKALLRSAQEVVNSANKNGETPLYLASKFGAHDILCSLLQKKPVLKFTTPQESAIHIAAQKGHDACLKMLLRSAKSKDFIKLRKMKVHPLHLSSKHGHLECAQLLLTSSFGDQDFKENLTSKTENGHYPVDKAFAGMHGEVFTFLLIQMAKDDKDEDFSVRLHGYLKKSMEEIDMGNEQQKAKLLAFRSAVLEAVIESNWCNVAFNTQFCGNIRQPLTANEEEVHNKIKPCDSFARLISNRPDLACRALDKHITLLPGGNRELHDYTPFEFIYYRIEIHTSLLSRTLGHVTTLPDAAAEIYPQLAQRAECRVGASVNGPLKSQVERSLNVASSPNGLTRLKFLGQALPSNFSEGVLGISPCGLTPHCPPPPGGSFAAPGANSCRPRASPPCATGGEPPSKEGVLERRVCCFKEGVLSGIICIHVDDFCWAGEDFFRDTVINSLKDKFLIGTTSRRSIGPWLSSDLAVQATSKGGVVYFSC
ncbi:ankyrin-1-like [Hyalella azteca]|uniref:Ankyrin-1-like n=1 Tax=Hyalella azteca TaxID=294128 RepID=A0A979FI61_HYAAZ|nr:ankyrin-1-like [Hyalella azteca]